MADKKYPNSGILFKNKDKKEERHADYSGTAEVDGVDYYINAWIKEGKAGKFFSLSFKPKRAASSGGLSGGGTGSLGGRKDLDDDCPF